MTEVLKKPSVYAGVKNRARKLKRDGYFGPPVRVKDARKYLHSVVRKWR